MHTETTAEQNTLAGAPIAGAARVKLKNFKHSEFASQETHCFKADVWLDGRKIGHVSNEGSGGPNHYTPPYVEQMLNDIAPPFTYEYGGQKHTITECADVMIGDLVNDKLYERDLKRALSKKILFIDPTGVMKETKSTTKDKLVAALKLPNLMEKLPAEKVLNLLPFDEALTIYKSYAGY